MHEWALAEAVVSTALKTVKDRDISEITILKIKIGELQQIELEIFEFALKEIMKNKELLENAEIKMEEESAVLKCNVCGHEWTFAKDNLSFEESESIHFIPEIAHTYIRCPKCDSPDFDVLKGRGVELESIEVR